MKKLTRKIFTISLILAIVLAALILSLSACGESREADAPPSQISTELSPSQAGDASSASAAPDKDRGESDKDADGSVPQAADSAANDQTPAESGDGDGLAAGSETSSLEPTESRPPENKDNAEVSINDL